ncbi:MAG TPA: small ribosomal subunit Rsm22 family protein [Opitutaceae bacterium]
MTWDEIDWKALDRLRDGFLSGTAADGPYWRSLSDLASYDFTYGERIGWKWDAVLRELTLRGWTPPRGLLVDWGCGSGIAGRRALRTWGATAFTGLRVWDHSPHAREFATSAARTAYPELKVATYADDEPIGLLVLSHIINELNVDAKSALERVIERAAAVIWIEPGTSAVSRDLVAWRERLRATHRLIAPCTHAAPCGLIVNGDDRDWCHHFAPAPSGIYADSQWVRFGQRAGIDLRSLPYAYLVFAKPDQLATDAPLPEGAARILGRPEHFKPYARVFSCDASGVEELTIPRRTCGTLYKQLERTKGPLLYQWRRNGGTVSEGTPLVDPDQM